MKRLAALDGFRGVAILFVLARHLEQLPTGGLGVDLFFGLSGYLITTILLAERDEKHFWRLFYIRRIARIVPAFLLMLLLATFMVSVDWRVAWPYILFAGVNFALVTHGPDAAVGALGVLWSLNVEEHFYLLWPIQVRRWSRRTLVWILLAVLAAEPISRVVATLHGATWAQIYLLTPFRLDGLVLGALLAIGMENGRVRHWLEARIEWLLLAWIPIFAVNFYLQEIVAHQMYCSMIGYTLTAVTSPLLIVYLLLRPKSTASRLFSSAPLVFLGRISYGLYLFHLHFVAVAFRFAASHGYTRAQGTKIAAAALSILFSWFSFRFLETPIMRFARTFSGRYSEERAVAAAAAN